MDDSFDELDIPDNWLELGSKRRNEGPDFIIDKRLKSESTGESLFKETSVKDGYGILESHLNYDNGYNNFDAIRPVVSENVLLNNKNIEEPAHNEERNNAVNVRSPNISTSPPINHYDNFSSMGTAPVVDETVQVTEEDSVRTFIREEGVDNDEVLEAGHVTPIISSSPLSDPYGEWSVNEPEFYDNTSNQSLPKDNQNAEHKTYEVEIPLANFPSLSSTPTLEDQSLNQPELNPSFHQEITVEPSPAEKVQPAANGYDHHHSFEFSDNSIVLEDSNVERYVEHLSFTDDELRFISSEPGEFISVEHDNSSGPSSSRTGQGKSLHDNNEKTGLKKISSLVRDAKIIASIVPDRDFNDIYNTLLDNRDNDNRLDIATVQLLEKAPASNEIITLDLFEEVQMVMSAVPTADANIVYTLLESLPPSSQRVKQVINQLNPALAGAVNIVTAAAPSNKKPALKKKESSVDDPFLKNDPLFRDMRTIARMFPEIDRNEIYAMLEANHNRSNRLQAVIEELGHLDRSEGRETAISPEESFTLSAEGRTNRIYFNWTLALL